MAEIVVVPPVQSGDAIRTVQRIVARCESTDGVAALNEKAQLQFRHRGLEDARLWLARATPDADPLGFALLNGTELDLAVLPEQRWRGVGGALAAAALPGLDRVEAWSHADHPAAAALAARWGVPRARELVIMERPTRLPLGPVSAPPGIEVRSFLPGDENALVALNAEAFADHPEQGALTLADFAERTGEDWFDPEGLFLAFAEEGLVGFHWTKVHREADPPHGEVYVVGVSPHAAGRGLGTALTRIGLRHLAGLGVQKVILYVEGDNAPALSVYRKQGFSPVRTEVQYRGPVPSNTRA